MPLDLVVVAGDRVATHPLPESGAVCFGRGDDCDIRVDNHSVSRRHALLHIGPPLRVEDLGGANGTFVPDLESPVDADGTHPLRRLSKNTFEVAVGMRISLGTVTIVVRERAADTPTDDDDDFVRRDPQMRDLYGQAARVARASTSVLILGETGAGKEVLARAIHRRSPRAAGPFLAVNCGALPESTLEDELFGHVKGAFTGATHDRAGLFEAAHKGTLFLDEVGELSPASQVRLLRVLEERKVTRLGGNEPRRVDVRLIAATHRDLRALVDGGAFREDLYFRLDVVALTIPPLRDRKGEIRPLAERFAEIFSAQLNEARAPAFSPEALCALERYAWPGNIRELRNAVERAVVTRAGASIQCEDLPPRVTAPPADRGTSVDPALDGPERRRIVAALAKRGGNASEAAKDLGMSRRTLVNRLRDYQIPRPRRSRDD